MNFGYPSVSAGWQAKLKDAAGQNIYFIPAFEEIEPTDDFFTQYPVCDGAMNWNSWAPAGAGDNATVPVDDDKTYLNAARAANKQFMMGLSPLQFKHIDSNQNWYRRAEENLPVRFAQVLEMQPDMIELQTWNDCGEGHNMGYIWEESLTTAPSIQAYAAGRMSDLMVGEVY